MHELILTTKQQLNALISASVERALDDRIAVEQRKKKDWLTSIEAREYLGVSRSTLQRYRASGDLPYSKIGKKIYFRRADVVAFLEQNQR